MYYRLIPLNERKKSLIGLSLCKLAVPTAKVSHFDDILKARNAGKKGGKMIMGSQCLMLFLAVGAGLIMPHFQHSNDNKRVTVRALKKEIKKNLPLGSTASQVIAFLDARGIDHSELATEDYLSDYPGETDLRLIRAAIPRVKQGPLVEWGIFMSFRFDEKDRLIDYKVKLVGTGP